MLVAAPSGAGKTTLTRALLKRVSGVELSISHTTRALRGDEIDGKHYHFIDKNEFRRMVAADEFLEWAEVHGNYYGTARSEIERCKAARILLFDIDHQGVPQIMSRCPDATSIFILPPDMPTLEARLRGRGSDSEATIERRLNAARGEIEHYGLFDYLLVNDDLERSIQQLISISIAEECRRLRCAPHVEQLLQQIHAP